MRYIWTIIWTFLLIQMSAYVIGSMQSATYSFKTVSIVSLVVVVLIFIIGALIPDEPVENAQH
ncbi:YjzD family protein [Fredinandcohnia quinoae]|uniref:YjzD family protein n=1 Tax=Fredinandcohnia quinoae TaxID=2918902 RepID=A0AAW5DZ07_9BACI|nr:YjzD family protein [Fredinandcohnia sp. SECRCQ15]MCH1625877.1 YjzD family protein [Fredinandcohnia sp. SECRCQ15]